MTVELHKTGTFEGCSTDWATAPPQQKDSLINNPADLFSFLIVGTNKLPSLNPSIKAAAMADTAAEADKAGVASLKVWAQRARKSGLEISESW